MTEHEEPADVVLPDYIAMFVNRSSQLERFQEMLAGETDLGAMLIPGDEKMGKTFLLNKMVYHCRQDGIPVVHVDFRSQAAADFLWLARQVRDQLEQWTGPKPFQRLTHLINHFTDPSLASLSSSVVGGFVDLSISLPGRAGETAARVDLKELHSQLQARFSLEELYNVARSIQLLPDDIPGTTRARFAAELLAYCRRRNCLVELLVAIEGLRPTGDWWTERPETGEIKGLSSRDDGHVVDRRRDTLPHESRALALARSQIDGAIRDALRIVSKEQVVALLFDTYDEATEEAMAWIHENLLSPIGMRLFQSVVVVVAGRPPLPEAGRWDPYVGTTTLQPFTVEHIGDYLRKRNITGEDPAALLRLTKGKPGLLAGIAANLLPAPSTQTDDW